MKAVIALGANLEDPEQAVEIALALLAQAGEVLSASSLYKTKLWEGQSKAITSMRWH